jgi:hypothetical protein
MSKTHRVIFIPGLGDQVNHITWLTNHWRHYKLIPIVHPIGWYDNKNDFSIKLSMLIKLIDKYSSNGNIVSLVGCSAGGSAVLNAYLERKTKVHRVINVCGRLRSGNYRGLRSFKARTASSPAFAQSIKLFEKNEVLLSKKDRHKIMTVRALFGDEAVPGDTAILSGVSNITIPTIEHVFSISMALTIFSNRLISFLTN